MDKNQMMHEIQDAVEEAADALRNGDEDGCYDKLLSVIDEATQLSEKLELTY